MSFIPNYCQLCNLSITQGYKIHIKECPEYLGALDKSECVICEKKLNNSSEMMLHLRYKHFLATTTDIKIKTEPAHDVSKENESKIANADQKFRIKLPGRPCDKCKKMMRRNKNGFECLRCSDSSQLKNDRTRDEPDMDLDQDLDFNNLDLKDKEDQIKDHQGITKIFNVDDITIKPEPLLQNSDEETEKITNLVCNTQSTISISVKNEPLTFPGKPKYSRDIEIITLSDEEDDLQPMQKSDTLPRVEQGLPCVEQGLPRVEQGLPCVEQGLPRMEQGLPCVEQAMTLSDLDPQEKQAMAFKRFSCPMCNDSNHAFKEKILVETHIVNEHKIAIDMLRMMVEKGVIKINEETFYKCPMCNNPFQGKTALKEHITSGHNIGMEMFKMMVQSGVIKVPEKIFK